MTTPTTTSDMVHTQATKKAFVRLVPLLMAAYFMAFVDRTNVGLAKTSLEVDAGIDAAAYGLGAGLFFLTYALLEVPSNLILHRIGARVWISRIMITWGLITMATMFVNGPVTFYILRMLLGAAEAGLYPGILYLITRWFAQKDRAMVVGLVLLASSVAFIVANPIGGALMLMDGIGGLHGWQWLFLLEGIPTVLLGVLVLFALPNSPSTAKWLAPEEAAELDRRAVGDTEEQVDGVGAIVRNAMAKPFLLVIAAIYFMNMVATYGVIFFIPAIIEAMGVTSDFTIGLISALGGIGSVIGVLFFPRILKRTGKEVTLIATAVAGAMVMILLFLAVDGPVAQLTFLSAAMFFIVGVQPVFWSVLMARLGGVAAAAGLAFVNTIGLTGAFVGPYAFGLTEQATGSTASGMWVALGATVIGLLCVPLLAAMVRRNDRDHETFPSKEPLLEAL